MVVYLMRVIPAYFAAFTSNHRAVAPRWAMALFISSTDTFFHILLSGRYNILFLAFIN